MHHETSSIDPDGVFRPNWLNVRALDLRIDENQVRPFARALRHLTLIHDVDGDLGPVDLDLGWIGKQLVTIAAIAAGPLPFGADLRVSCESVLESASSDRTSDWEWVRRLGEMYVVRLSQPHEPLHYAVAAYQDGIDPVIWSFELAGRVLMNATKLN